MNKNWKLLFVIALSLMLIACGKNDAIQYEVSPTDKTETVVTPLTDNQNKTDVTITFEPMGTPQASKPPEVTESPEVTLTPVVTQTPEITEQQVVTKPPKATITPKATQTPIPTVTSKPEPTATNKPTITPQPTQTPVPTKSPVNDYVGFRVSDTKLLDANGNEFIMMGVNHAHAWYTYMDDTAIKAIAQTGANTIRIVCSDGQQYSKDTVASLNKVIDTCKSYNLIVVLEVHDITGSDSISALKKTAGFWISVKDVLIGNEDYVILNIANEWVGQWNSTIWKNGYTSVIPQIREAGINNTIMVDAAGWGQYGKSIKDYGIDVFESDPLGNTMFSIHMYGSAGKDAGTIKSNLTGVTNQNLCVIVGEFGYTHSDGDVNEDYIMQYCVENDLGYLGWSWKGNSGGVEYLDIATEWDGSVLSSDWGEKLINGQYGIMNNAEICTVY